MTRYSMLGLWLLIISSVAGAAPLTVLVGQHKPPYISTANISGYEVELLAEVVTRMGYEPVFIFVPNGRIKHLLEQDEGDIASLQPLFNEQEDLFYSNPYIRYQNVAVSLLKNQLDINTISDLRRYTVLAFQNARTLLGEDYNNMAKASSKYRETVDQQAQLHLLMQERVEAVVMDLNIFNHYRLQQDNYQQVVIHSVFNTSLYRAAFKDVKLQQAFDKALLSVMLDSWYLRLQRKYFGEANQTIKHKLLCAD